jgi:nucleoside-diphosphate-sugar epimerase
MTTARERVLLTGGSGFIGACMAHELLADGREVHLLLRPQARPWRLAGILGHCTVHRGDLRDADAVRSAVAAARPDVLYHLATHGAYPQQRQRQEVLSTNLIGTANVLDALEEFGCRALVHTGSSSEYGHTDRPMRESSPLLPRTDYGVSKAAATLLCQAAFLKGLPAVTVRVFSAYGPWEEPTRLVPYVMDCCARGVPPRVTAGRQPRDFVYVDDVVALLRRAAEDPLGVGPVLHAGTGRQATVRDMIDTILAVCAGGRLRADFGGEPARPDEPASWVADIGHTAAVTGWRPRFDLRAGVERMWQWFQTAARAAS